MPSDPFQKIDARRTMKINSEHRGNQIYPTLQGTSIYNHPTCKNKNKFSKQGHPDF